MIELRTPYRGIHYDGYISILAVGVWNHVLIIYGVILEMNFEKGPVVSTPVHKEICHLIEKEITRDFNIHVVEFISLVI